MSAIKLSTPSSGSISLSPANTASDVTITVPAVTGTMLTNKTAGTVLQVVQATTTTATTTSSTSFVSTTLAASITPSSASSKILIFGQVHAVGAVSTSQPNITLYRGGTNLVGVSYGLGDGYVDTGGYAEWLLPFSLLDSPSSTSSVTYTLYGRNASGASTVSFGSASRVCVITLMEIAA